MPVEVSDNAYMATVGPGDILFVPAGFLFHEKIGANAPVSGVKLCITSDADFDVLSACNTLVQRNGIKELPLVDVLVKRQ